MKSLSNKPLAYQKSWVEFYKLKFKVTPDVLIPRPETELLVDEVLSFLSAQSINNTKQLAIIDIGTGSGNIAISLAKNLSHLSPTKGVAIVASDISQKALKLAQQNAKFHWVEKQITFIQSNLLSSIPCLLLPSPLLIIANLPYIPHSRISKLALSVKDYEPILALDGGKDGFDLYRKLLSQIKGKGVNPISIICEIDDTQSKIAQKEARKYFPNARIEIKKDLFKKPRVLIIKLS